METNELELARRRVMRMRPAEVVRAEPLTITGVHAARVVPAREGRLARFHGWRRDHYVADQALRVLGILAVVLTVFAALVALALWIVAQIVSAVAPFAPTIGGAVAVALILGTLFLPRGRGKSDGHRGGYGFHYGKCKR